MGRINASTSAFSAAVSTSRACIRSSLATRKAPVLYEPPGGPPPLPSGGGLPQTGERPTGQLERVRILHVRHIEDQAVEAGAPHARDNDCFSLSAAGTIAHAWKTFGRRCDARNATASPTGRKFGNRLSIRTRRAG